ncbi:chloride channel protein 2 [Hyalella azteca]|uniref:Chloride channel protein 2 n=1 Tax=Hyalella azteca TaxID=294128 RepID=A0A8B7P5T5_HYAAZ|nr:chloride channel protein 2 [Hyalella azteca]
MSRLQVTASRWLFGMNSHREIPATISIVSNDAVLCGVSRKMYGKYRKELSEFAKQEAKLAKKEAKRLQKIDPTGLRPRRNWLRRWAASGRHGGWKFFTNFVRKGDWAFLLSLGMTVACISLFMDMGIATCNKAQLWAYSELTTGVFQKYIAWVTLPVMLVLFSASFTQFVAPQAIGSGIPEMKTIMRGVVLKEYLTWRTLVAKLVGLTATLGSGLPLGKVGPFVHIASMVATQLRSVFSSLQGVSLNESRKTEMLAAAAAVGVASAFSAPIGGVLFSIEVTAEYFAVRNYWRGFFAAVCGSVMFRLLAVFYYGQETFTALFKTNFKSDFPFDLKEIFAYMFLGLVCGLLGALFVFVHRNYVLFMRRNKKVKNFLQKYRLMYPCLVTLVYSSLTFPLGYGQFVAGELSTPRQVMDLFSNFSWVSEQHSPEQFEIVQHWRTPWTGIFVNLVLYSVFIFFWLVVASTLPIPAGVTIPFLKIGAAIGRILGEFMAYVNPTGIGSGALVHSVIPGAYSVAGAAAFAGATTHTISTSVILFELTGQITHLAPVMIAVLTANAVAILLQPSIYDSIILIKNLPYLPEILTSASDAYDIFVERFMVRKVKYIYHGITYKQLKDTLLASGKISSLPLVDSPTSMILLGSIQRDALISLLQAKLEQCRDTGQFSAAWKLAIKKAQEAQPSRKTSIKNVFDFTSRSSSTLNKLKNVPRMRRRSSSLEDLRVLRKSIKSRPLNSGLSAQLEKVTNASSVPSTDTLTSTSPRLQSLKSLSSSSLKSLMPECVRNSASENSVEHRLKSKSMAEVENDSTIALSGSPSTISPHQMATEHAAPGIKETFSLPNLAKISPPDQPIQPDEPKSELTQRSTGGSHGSSVHQDDKKPELVRKNSRFAVTRVLSPIDTSSGAANETEYASGVSDAPAFSIGVPSVNPEKKLDPEADIATTIDNLLEEAHKKAQAVDTNFSKAPTNLENSPTDKDGNLAAHHNGSATHSTPGTGSCVVTVSNEEHSQENRHQRRKKNSERSMQPRRSILKKTAINARESDDHSSNSTLQRGPTYATYHGDTSKNWRTAVDALRRKMMPNDTPTGSIKSNLSLRWKQVMEQSALEQSKFEEKVYKETVDFSTCPIDPSPFQLVESTSLIKVHSLFSLLGQNHAYVTVLGRLIGVVALKELRAAIEAINNGTPQPNDDVGPDEGVDVNDEESNVALMAQNLRLGKTEGYSEHDTGNRR